MQKSRAKKQLRRCARCQKVGHNKSTCTEKRSAALSQPTAQPLKFFVHHVAHTPTNSPHVVDLKTEQNSANWNHVETTTLSTPAANAFHAYHTLPVQLDTPEPTSTNFKSSEHAYLEPKAKLTTTPKPEIKKTVDAILLASAPVVSPTIEELVLERSRTVQTKKISNQKISHPILKPFVKKSIAALHSTLLATATGLHKAITPARAVAVIVLCMVAVIAPGTARGYYVSLRTTANTVAQKSTAGFMALAESTTALKNADVEKAQAATASAVANFNTALDTLENNHTFLQTIVGAIPVVNNQVISRQKIILAGQEIAVGNSYLLQGIDKTTHSPSSSLSDQLDTIVSHLQAAIPNYTKALENLNDVDSTTIPLEYQSEFIGFRTLLVSVVHDFKNIADLGDSLHDIFGGAGKRRYLIVFQNQYELRPTGGFMGSFAVVDIKDGKVVNWELTPGGSYDLQGQLSDFLVPPTPLLLSNKRWLFHDANWFPDFPASAQKMLWFYRHSGGVSADGVIAINASVLERLLSIMGPITDNKRQVTLTADTALPIIQDIVETGPEKKDHKPKQILTDLAPTFISYFENIKPKDLMPLLSNLDEALSQKEIQLYFTDPALEQTITDYGWSGRIVDAKQNQDYLMVVNTNLQGQKSDARIKQTISHEATIADNGRITDTVTITRIHTGEAGEKLYGQTNIDYLRLYVPQGSTLISANGFTWPDEKAFKTPESWYVSDADLAVTEQEVGTDENSGTRITNEFGKTSFGNWVVTEPGSTSVVQFTYQLPFSLPLTSDSQFEEFISAHTDSLSNYRLIVQKQSGITSDFESQIIFPQNWHPAWYEGDHTTPAQNGLAINTFPLKTDTTWAVILKK